MSGARQEPKPLRKAGWWYDVSAKTALSLGTILACSGWLSGWVFFIGLGLWIILNGARNYVKDAFRERVRAADYLMCLGCGYDLRGSPEHGRCSECGKEFHAIGVRRTWYAAVHPRPAAPSRAPPDDPPLAVRMHVWRATMFVLGAVAVGLAVLMQSSGVLMAGLVVALAVSLVGMAVRAARLMTLAREAGYSVCTHCGYDMRGVSVPRCPECGCDFDRDRAIEQWRAWCRDGFRRSKRRDDSG